MLQPKAHPAQTFDTFAFDVYHMTTRDWAAVVSIGNGEWDAAFTTKREALAYCQRVAAENPRSW